MRTCKHCKKNIKRGPAVLIAPPTYMIALGLASADTWYHSKCAAALGLDVQ